MMSGYATGKKVYKVSKLLDTPDNLTAAPCGVCPVVSQVCAVSWRCDAYVAPACVAFV
jgi:hypothetical protein